MEELRLINDSDSPVIIEAEDPSADSDKVTEGASRLRAVATIIACTIGGGLISLPAAFTKAGIVPAILITLLAMILTACSLYSLAAVAAMEVHINSYGDLVRHLFGKRVARVTEFAIGLFICLVIGGNLIIVRDFFDQQFSVTSKTPNNSTAAIIGDVVALRSGAEPVASQLATSAVGLVVTLLALPRSMGRLGLAATAATVTFTFLVFVLIYFGAAELHDDAWRRGNITVVPLWPDLRGSDIWSAEGTPLPAIMYAFGCQFQVIDIFRATTVAAPPDRRHGSRALAYFVPVALAATASQATLFTSAGCFGLLAFPGQNITGDMLGMLSEKGTAGEVARWSIVLALICAAPLLVQPTKALTRPMVVEFTRACGAQNAPQGWKFNAALTLAIMAIATGLALSSLPFLLLVRVMGAVLVSPLCFMLPGTSHWRVAKLRGEKLGAADAVICGVQVVLGACLLGISIWHL